MESSPDRKISYGIYLAAFLVSLSIFVIGVYLGGMLDQYGKDNLSKEITDVYSRAQSMQVLLLLDDNSSSFCPLYSSELSKLESDVESVGYKLSYLEDIKKIYDDDLKRQYFVLEAESYLMAKKVKSLCTDRSVLLINFYSNKNCTVCKEAGIEVLKARDSLLESNPSIHLRLFSFDGELQSPVADAFVREYNVTSYPSLVINGHLYQGPLDSAKIEALIRNAS